MRRRERSTSRAMVSSWIGAGFVKDEILEMHEFAVEPQRGASVGEVLPFQQAYAGR
jgi:hypothetical protein